MKTYFNKEPTNMRRLYIPLIAQLRDLGLPGEVEQTSGTLQTHEVVSQVEVGDILAVE